MKAVRQIFIVLFLTEIYTGHFINAFTNRIERPFSINKAINQPENIFYSINHTYKEAWMLTR